MARIASETTQAVFKNCEKCHARIALVKSNRTGKYYAVDAYARRTGLTSHEEVAHIFEFHSRSCSACKSCGQFGHRDSQSFSCANYVAKPGEQGYDRAAYMKSVGA